MSSPERQIKPADRRISGYTIAFGVVGFLVLATGFFFLGMLCIGPMVKGYMKSTPRAPRIVVQRPTPAPTPPAVQTPADAAAADSAGQADGSLDVQVTEEGQESSTADQSDGVKQDADGLTVTLEPNEQHKAEQPTAAEEVPKPSEQPASANRSDTPKADTASDGKPAVHASSPAIGGRSKYRVHVGTFASKPNADALAKDLRDHGYKPDVRAVQGEAGTLYRVEVGEYKTRQGAQDLADDLSGKGYSPSVTTAR